MPFKIRFKVVSNYESLGSTSTPVSHMRKKLRELCFLGDGITRLQSHLEPVGPLGQEHRKEKTTRPTLNTFNCDPARFATPGKKGRHKPLARRVAALPSGHLPNGAPLASPRLPPRGLSIPRL